MLRRDRICYRRLLRRLSLGELLALYEQSMPDFEVLAEFIAQELDIRLGRASHIAA